MKALVGLIVIAFLLIIGIRLFVASRIVLPLEGAPETPSAMTGASLASSTVETPAPTNTASSTFKGPTGAPRIKGPTGPPPNY